MTHHFTTLQLSGGTVNVMNVGYEIVLGITYSEVQITTYQRVTHLRSNRTVI